MRECLRCGKSLEGKHPAAKYCGVACRVAGYVYRQTGKMPGKERGGRRPGAGRKPGQTNFSGKSAKSNETTYVYAIGWGPNLGCEGIKRYEVRKGRNRLFVQPDSYDFIPLPADWNPADFRWRFVGIRHDPNRMTIERKSGYWLAQDAQPAKYYSLKQIENQWRRIMSEAEIDPEPDPWEDVLEMLGSSEDPKQKARQLLGVSTQANAKEIKRAYRKLSNQYHPDRGGDGVQMREINAAYRLLIK
jgi:molecular chaperone DnaJ